MTGRQHLLTAIVAVAVLALALPDGGYSTGVYAGATLALWWAVVMLLAFGPGPPAKISIIAIVAGAALLGLALLSALSIAWSSDDGRALAEAVRAAGYAGLFALVVVTSRAGDARGWLAGIAIAFAAVAIVALASRFQPSLPGGDDDIAQVIPGPLARLSYPIGYWNGLATTAAIGAVLLAWLGAVSRERVTRALAVGAIPLFGLVIYLTSSRGGVAAAVLGIAALLIFGRQRLQLISGLLIGGAGAGILILLASRRPELVDAIPGDIAEEQGNEMAIFTVLVAAAVVAGRWFLDDWLERLTISRNAARAAIVAVAVILLAGLIVSNPPERLDQFKDPPPEEIDTRDFVASHITSSAGNGRYQYWSAAIDAFEDEPFRGIGAGGYEAFWIEHGSLARPIRDAHSLVLEAGAELGILGLGLVVAFFGAAIAGAVRRPREGDGLLDSGAALAVLVAGGAVAATDWIWELPVVFAPVVIAAALLTGPATGPSLPSAPGSPRGWGLATLLAGSIAIFASAIVLITEIKLADSHDAVREGDLAAAAQDAQDAITIQPWAAEPRLQLGLVEERAGDLTAAREELEEAIAKARDDWRLWFVLARIDTKAGRIKAAQEALGRARALNPNAAILAVNPSAPTTPP
jgi:O-Antigen ligase/Tetratricopeptide repeat